MAAMSRHGLGTSHDARFALSACKGGGRRERLVPRVRQRRRPLGPWRLIRVPDGELRAAPVVPAFTGSCGRLIPLLLFAAWLALAGCDDARTVRPQRVSHRAVSLSPALTQILLDLELGDQVVGVGRDDPLAGAEGVAVVGGGLRSIDREKMVAADPTAVVVQSEAGRLPTGLTEMAGRRSWAVHAYKIETIGDIRAAIADGLGGGIGEVMGVPARALELRNQFDRKLEAVAGATRDTEPRRVLLVVEGGAGGQIMACGVNTFLDQLLPRANAYNALDGLGEDGGEPMAGYPMLDLETVLERAGELVVIVSTSPPDASGGQAKGALVHKLREQTGRDFEVRVLRDEKALLPTTTLPRVGAKLAKVIHPEVARRVDEALAEAGSPAAAPAEGGDEPASGAGAETAEGLSTDGSP